LRRRSDEHLTLNLSAALRPTLASEIGDAENSYLSRILRLALPAPDIVEAILAGRADHSLMLETLERPLPASWVEQRCLLMMQ
jgi:hypothetical protein